MAIVTQTALHFLALLKACKTFPKYQKYKPIIVLENTVISGYHDYYFKETEGVVDDVLFLIHNTPVPGSITIDDYSVIVINPNYITSIEYSTYYTFETQPDIIVKGEDVKKYFRTFLRTMKNGDFNWGFPYTKYSMCIGNFTNLAIHGNADYSDKNYFTIKDDYIKKNSLLTSRYEDISILYIPYNDLIKAGIYADLFPEEIKNHFDASHLNARSPLKYYPLEKRVRLLISPYKYGDVVYHPDTGKHYASLINNNISEVDVENDWIEVDYLHPENKVINIDNNDDNSEDDNENTNPEEPSIPPVVIPPVPDTYTRPEDRPSIPVLNNNEIYLLFGVSPTGSNDYALTLTLNTGTYRVNWGDGTTNTYNSNVKSEHIFNYNTLDILPNSNGIKYVYIKYSSVNNITGININVRHSNRPTASSSNIYVPKVYEMYIKASEVTSFNFSSSIYTRYQLLEILKYIDSNKISNFSYFLCYWYNLRVLDIDTSNGTNFSCFLYYCRSFNQPLNIDTGNGTNFSYFLYNCTSFNQPLEIDTGNGTSFSSFLYGCSSFNQPLDIDTGNGTNFNTFLTSCNIFNQPLDIDTGNGTSFSMFLYQCNSFNQPLNIDMSNGISFTNFLYQCNSYSHSITVDLSKVTNAIGTSFIGTACYALTGLHLLNMGSIHTALTISNSSLDADALVLLFNDLYDRTSISTGTITITGCYGASRLTAKQRAIATNKNWTIVG